MNPPPARPGKGVERWGDVVIAPGERADVAVTVSESYSGRDVEVPVHVWRAKEPGPTVFVTAAVHGDEINGTGAIRHIVMDQPFQLRAGALVLAPVVNLLGFERHSRYLPDRRDLNRSFPGSHTGSLAGRLARTVYEHIVTRCDYGIDLHTAAVRRTNFPNVRADMAIPELAQLARAFGVELIISGEGPKGSLRRSACRAGVPTLILEAGEVWKVEQTYVEYATLGIRNCLIHLGMVEGDLVEPPFRIEADKTQWLRSEHGGFLRFHVAPGEIVEAGQHIATTTSLLGEAQGVIEAPRAGVVLGMTTLPASAPGDPVCHLAYVASGPLQRAERAQEALPGQSLHERTRESLAQRMFLREPGQDLTGA